MELRDAGASGIRRVAAIDRTRAAEIEDDDGAVLAYQAVPGMDVAVQDAAGVQAAIGFEHCGDETVQPAQVARGPCLLRVDRDRDTLAPFHRDEGPSPLDAFGQEFRAVHPVQVLQNAGFLAEHRRDGGRIDAGDLQRDRGVIRAARPIDLGIVQRSDDHLDFEPAKRLTRRQAGRRGPRVDRVRRHKNPPVDKPRDRIERHIEDRERVLAPARG